MQVFTARLEANDNMKYLRTLEDWFDKLNDDGDFPKLLEVSETWYCKRAIDRSSSIARINPSNCTASSSAHLPWRVRSPQ